MKRTELRSKKEIFIDDGFAEHFIPQGFAVIERDIF